MVEGWGWKRGGEEGYKSYDICVPLHLQHVAEFLRPTHPPCIRRDHHRIYKTLLSEVDCSDGALRKELRCTNESLKLASGEVRRRLREKKGRVDTRKGAEE
jgi:hypothetical protein